MWWDGESSPPPSPFVPLALSCPLSGRAWFMASNKQKEVVGGFHRKGTFEGCGLAVAYIKNPFDCQVADLLLRNPRDLLPIEAEPNAYHVVQHASFVLFLTRSPPVHLIGWVDPVCREEHVAQGGWVREAKKSCGCETKGLHHSLSPGILPSTTKGRTRPYHSVDLRRRPRCYSPTYHVSSLCSFADLTRRQVCLISAVRISQSS